MKCPRCGGRMGETDIYSTYEKCSSFTCYRCGEVIDDEILKNRGIMIRAAEESSIEAKANLLEKWLKV